MLGSHSATRSPGPTPRSARPCAARAEQSSSSAKLSVRSPWMRAGESGVSSTMSASRVQTSAAGWASGMRRGDYLKRFSSQAVWCLGLTRHDACSTLVVGDWECLMLRRTLLAAPLVLAAAPASAQWAPKQPIKILVGYAPGGTADIAARIAADTIQRQHGYTVIVDNKTGAGGFIALKSVAQSPPDGYTVGIGI